MPRRLSALSVPLALVACTCADPAAPPPGPPIASAGAAATTTAVVLLPSFEVRAEDGAALPSHVPAVAFTPDGATLVIGTAQGEVIAFDAATRAVRRRERFAGGAIHAVAIDRGARALCWVGDGVLEARAPGSGERLGRVEDVADAKVLAVAPRGDLVALGRGGQVEVRRVPGLDVVASADLHAAAVSALAFSPDGARLASAGEDGRLLVLDVTRGLEPVHEERAPEPLYAACWTPDGGAVLFGGREKAVDRLETAGWTRARLLEQQPFDITTLGVAPDGSRLAVGDESCDVWIFDLASRENLFHGKHHVECWLSAVAWAPDSETFLFGCRPNTLASEPALFAANRVAEAYQDPAHLALVAEEREALLELASSVGDPALAADLRAQAEALALAPAAPGASSEEGAGGVLSFDGADVEEGTPDFAGPELGLALGGTGGGGGTFSFDADEESEATVLDPDGPAWAAPEVSPEVLARAKAAATAPAAKAKLEQVEALRARRASALKARVAELEGAFQVNVWRAGKR